VVTRQQQDTDRIKERQCVVGGLQGIATDSVVIQHVACHDDNVHLLVFGEGRNFSNGIESRHPEPCGPFMCDECELDTQLPVASVKNFHVDCSSLAEPSANDVKVQFVHTTRGLIPASP
jgi:hypothetical protein